jgi:hypothetical protein
MSAETAEVVRMLLAINAGAIVLLVPLSFVASALALESLGKLDSWLRRREEASLTPPDVKALPAPEPTARAHL